MSKALAAPIAVMRPSRCAYATGRIAACLLLLSSLSACAPYEKKHSSLIKVDGSGTLFSLIEAFAELNRAQKNLPIVIGSSGTGSGINRLCRGELDIATASRTMTPLEQQQCKQIGIEYFRIPVAMDAITIIVHPHNTWIDCTSPEQLKQMWEVQAQYHIKNWQQINPAFPPRPLHLYGPGINSGTYSYFSRAILGKAHASRGDYAASEDDNLTVQGVAGDINGLGFLGMAYWLDNKTRLKALGIRQPNGQCSLPEPNQIKNEQYQPLSRRLYVYVNKNSYQRNEVLQRFIAQLLNPQLNYTLSLDNGFIPLSSAKLATARRQLEEQAGIKPQSAALTGQVK